MTSQGGRFRDDIEGRARMPGSGKAGLLRLGIGLHCRNTRHRAKDGVFPFTPQLACAAAPLVEEEEEEETSNSPPAARLTCCSISSASCREPTQIERGTTVGEKYRNLYPGISSRWASRLCEASMVIGLSWKSPAVLPSAITHHARNGSSTSDPFAACFL